MSNVLWLMVNKTGKSFDVYDHYKNDEYRGTIGNREAFIWYGGEGALNYIFFRGKDLELVDPTVYNTTAFFNNCSRIIDYPYGTATINGTKYKTFLMRRTMNVYTAAANYWGKVAGGMLVATNSATVGAKHPTWKAVDYVKSTAGKWVKVDGDGYDHGFVDFDLGNGSMPSNIALYGSW